MKGVQCEGSQMLMTWNIVSSLRYQSCASPCLVVSDAKFALSLMSNAQLLNWAVDGRIGILHLKVEMGKGI